MNYDTINLKLPNDYYSQSDLNNMIYKLENPVENNHSVYGYSVKGFLNGAQIYCSSHSLKLDKTSLPRVIKGSNEQEITLNEVELYIESLSDHLHLPMHESSLTKVHFCHDFITDYSPSRYISSFVSMPRYKRRSYDNEGVKFVQKCKSSKYYDKSLQMKMTSPGYKGDNLNRFRSENEYNSRLKHLLKQFDLKASCLYSREFYNYHVNSLADNYFKINKMNKTYTTLKPATKPKDIRDMICAIGVNSVGEEDLINQIESWYKTGEIDYDNKYRAIKMIQSYSDLNGLDRADLIKELDIKVEEARKSYLL